MPSIQEDCKVKARTALEPYLKGCYSEAVKNPVLLLNYLYQRNIVPQPVYDIRPHPEKQFHFIASCTVGDVKTTSEGSSKKDAKSNVADEFLDILLNDKCLDTGINANSMNGDSDTKNLSLNELRHSLEGMNMELDHTEGTTTLSTYPKQLVPDSEKKNFYDDDIGGIFSFGMKEPVPKSNSLKTRKRLKSRRKVKLQKSGTWVPMDEVPTVAEPQGELPEVSQRIDQYLPVSQYQLHFDPFARNSVISKSANYNQTSQCVKETNSLNISSKNNCEIPKPPAEILNPTLIYFDPFSKLRPSVMNSNSADAGREKELAPKEKLPSGNTATDPLSDGDTKSTAQTEKKSPSEENMALVDQERNKTPFQILYEKSVRKLKRIPRCRIERCDDGFMCKLVLGTHTSIGKANSKKEAKVKAAEALLRQLENL